MTNTMMFRTTANDFRGEPQFKILVEAETGQPGTITVLDTGTLQPVLFIKLPAGVAMNLSSAFGLVASMEQEQLKDDLIRGGE